MKKYVFVLMFLVLAGKSHAHDAANDFIWMAGAKNLAPINLASGHTVTEGIKYSYAVDCSDQTPNPNGNGKEKDPAPIFSCQVDEQEKQLRVALNANQTGIGKIKVYAIGRDLEGVKKEDKEFSYNVTVISIPLSKPSECPDWNCNLGNAFYLGYEGTSVSQINEKGNVRFQYSGYAQFQPSHWFHLHVLGDVMQTSLQEQATVKSDCATEDPENSCEVVSTIAGNLGLFMPIFDARGETSGEAKPKNPGTIIMGPMAEYSIRKLDTADEFASSYYIGYRFAYSKIRYFGVGYGKSEGIPGKRIKIGGQLPIYDEKLLVGLTLNIAADNKAKNDGLSSGDSINIYILTHVDFTKIFTSFTD